MTMLSATALHEKAGGRRPAGAPLPRCFHACVTIASPTRQPSHKAKAGGTPPNGALGAPGSEDVLVVVSVNFTLTGLPLSVTEAWANSQLAPTGALAQVSCSCLSKPLEGVTTTVYAAGWPEMMVSSAGEADSEKSARRTVSVT